MNDQTEFDFDFESREKKAILDELARIRSDLIERAKTIAVQIAKMQGTVSSPEVVRVLKAEHAPGIDEVSTKFMGAVFREGWIRVGFEPKGSHCQPISVWRMKD